MISHSLHAFELGGQRVRVPTDASARVGEVRSRKKNGRGSRGYFKSDCGSMADRMQLREAEVNDGESFGMFTISSTSTMV